MKFSNKTLQSSKISKLFALAFSLLCTTFVIAAPENEGWSRAETKAQMLPARDLGNISNVNRYSRSSSSNFPQEIIKLVGDLRNDPELIISFVHENIKLYPSYGVNRSALGTLLDRHGNYFEQANLALVMLQAAGHTGARVVVGSTSFNFESFSEQIGMFGARRNEARDLYERLGYEIPRSIELYPYLDYTEVLAGVYFDRTAFKNATGTQKDTERDALVAQQDNIWANFPMAFVEVNVDGQTKLFSPGIKNTVETISSGKLSPLENVFNDERKSNNKVNTELSAATGHADFSVRTFVPGDPVEEDYQTSIDRDALRNILDLGASNFIDYINTNYPDAGMDQLIGNEFKNINPELLTYGNASEVASWTSESAIPSAYMGTIKISYLNNNYEVPIAQVYDAPFYLTFNSNDKPVLKLGSQTLYTGTGNGFSSVAVAQMQMTWASQVGNSSTLFTQQYSITPEIDGVYNFVLAVGRSSVERMRHSSELISEAINSSGENSVLAKANVLRGIGIYYQYFLSLQESLDNRMYQPSHTIRALAVTGTNDNSTNGFPFITVGGVKSLLFGGNDFELFPRTSWKSLAESVAIEDTQGINATSTMSCFDFVNDSNNQLIKVAAQSSDNVADIDDAITILQSGLTFGWSYSALQRLKTELESDTSAAALLPIRVAGAPAFPRGCHIFLTDEYIAYRVSGEYDGGVANESADLDADFYQNFYEGKVNSEGYPVYSTTVNDPINFITGDFLYESKDLVTGSGKSTLGFRRSYDSSVTVNDIGLGRGWVHNYAVSLQQGTALEQAFGSDSVIDAAPYLVAMYVALNTGYDYEATTYHLIQSSIAKWTMDQIRNNALILNSGHKKETYIKLPGGKFNSPPHSDKKLSLVNGSYQINGRDGSVLSFNDNDQLSVITARNNDSVTLEYDGLKLDSVSNNYGRKIKLVYSGDELEKVQDVKTDDTVLREVEYRYTNENLTSYINAINETTTYGYDSNNLMDNVYYPQFPNDSALVNYYDDWGRVYRQTSPDGGDHYYYYAEQWRSEEVGPSQQSLIHYFDKSGNTILTINGEGESQKFEFDGVNRLSLTTSINDDGIPLNTTRYSYFPNHLIQYQYVSELLSDGTTGDVFGTGFTYEDQYGLVSTISEIKEVTREEDNFGFSTVTPSESRVIRSNGYDDNYRLQTVTSPSFDDADGSEVTPVTTFEYQDSTDNVKYELAPDGLVTEYFYYTTGEIYEVIADADHTSNTGVPNKKLTTTYTYNGWGDPETVTNPLNQVTYTEFDALRRLRKEIQRYELVNDQTPSVIETQIDYPGAGQVIVKQKSDDLALHPTGWVITTSQYNKAGKLLTEVDHSGDTLTYEYDLEGRVEYITDPENRKIKYTYDDIHRLLTQSQKVNGSYVQTSGFVYDYENGNRKVSVTDANSNESIFLYDRLNRLTRTTYPDTSYESIHYFDDSPLVDKTTLRNSEEVSYLYDPLNRVKSVQYGSQEKNSIFHQINGQIDIVKQFKPAGSSVSEDVDYTYDGLRRIDYIDYPDNKKVNYGYDELGRKSTLTYPGNSISLTYIYDDFNRVEHVRRGTTNQVTYQYNSLSQIVKISYANNTYTDITYEADGDVESIIHSFANNERLGYRYSYNDAGQVTGSEAIGLATHWLPDTDETISFSPNELNQYDVVAGASITYNDNGQLKDDSSYDYLHDIKGDLSSVTPSGQSSGIDFKYNALGQRTEKDSYGERFNYTHDGLDVLQEYKNEAVNMQFIHGPGLDQPIMMIASGNNYYLHADKMGSILAVSDESGELLESYSYSPFGRSHDTSMIGNPYRYTARWLDSETDKYYFRARYYDQSWGRFIQPDPTGYADGLNMYAYVSNDPLNFYDPLGLSQRYHVDHSSIRGMLNYNVQLNYDSVSEISRFYWDEDLKDILGDQQFSGLSAEFESLGIFPFAAPTFGFRTDGLREYKAGAESYFEDQFRVLYQHRAINGEFGEGPQQHAENADAAILIAVKLYAENPTVEVGGESMSFQEAVHNAAVDKLSLANVLGRLTSGVGTGYVLKRPLKGNTPAKNAITALGFTSGQYGKALTLFDKGVRDPVELLSGVIALENK